MSSVVQANLDLLGQEVKITTMANILAQEAYFWRGDGAVYCPRVRKIKRSWNSSHQTVGARRREIHKLYPGSLKISGPSASQTYKRAHVCEAKKKEQIAGY